MTYCLHKPNYHSSQWKNMDNLEPDQCLLTFRFQSFHMKWKTRMITCSTVFMKAPENYLLFCQVFDIHQIVSQI